MAAASCDDPPEQKKDPHREIRDMPRYRVTHLRREGQDMIVVPLDKSFGAKSEHDKKAFVAELQAYAASAGLAGLVIPVWEGKGGGMNFIAPTPWHPFFQSIGLAFVMENINRELAW